MQCAWLICWSELQIVGALAEIFQASAGVHQASDSERWPGSNGMRALLAASGMPAVRSAALVR